MSGVISDNTVRSSGVVAPLSSATTDASNPARDTNPTDGVGTKWINTTTGQIFICIDATTDANEWVGQKQTSILPRVIWTGGNSDYDKEHDFGYPGKIKDISYVTPDTLGDATDFGDLINTNQYFTGTSNGTNERGVFGGGSSPAGGESNLIEYFTIATPGNAYSFGNLISGTMQAGASSNGTSDRAMWSGGGISGVDVATDKIDYITISTPGNAQDFGNLQIAKEYTAGTDNGSNDRGINASGTKQGGSSGNTDTIDYWTISSTGNAQDFGDLTANRAAPATCSNDTNNRGLFMAGSYQGSPNSYSNNIDYITISSTGNATDFGDMAGATPSGYSNNNGARGHAAGASSGTAERGMMAGGYTSISSVSNWYAQIEYVTISTPGNSTAFGNLEHRVYGPAGCSNTAN